MNSLYLNASKSTERYLQALNKPNSTENPDLFFKKTLEAPWTQEQKDYFGIQLVENEETKDPEELFTLGLNYKFGIFDKWDQKKSQFFLKKAFEQGSVKAEALELFYKTLNKKTVNNKNFTEFAIILPKLFSSMDSDPIAKTLYTLIKLKDEYGMISSMNFEKTQEKITK